MSDSLFPTQSGAHSTLNPELSLSPIQSSFLCLPAETSLKEAVERMAQEKHDCVVVMKGQQLAGIFTERDLVRLTTTQEPLEQLTLADRMSRQLITVQESETHDTFELLRRLRKHQIRHLPVLDAEAQVVGIVTTQSIRNLLKPEHLLRHIRTAEVIQQQVVNGSPDDNLLALSQKMSKHRVSCVVILRPETQHPIGIITERDIVRFHAMELDFEQVAAAQVMSQPLSIVKPQDSLWSIHQRMQQLKVRRLVVVDENGLLAGIATQSQILKVLDPMEMFQVMQQMQQTIDRQTEALRWLNQELQARNRELAHLSTVDELTQAVNRHKLNPFLEETWEGMSLLQQPLSLIMCDIDCFKAYNDNYGHLAGDQCLVQVAQALRATVRESFDLLARYGGEEFVLVLPNADSEVARRIAHSILQNVRDLQIPHRASNVAQYITVSAGVATAVPSASQSPSLLLKAADQLLYQSKLKGRDRYTIKNLALETTKSE